MGNLAARASGSLDPRPFQIGGVEGSKGGRPVSASKLWLVDTGAMASAITKDNADLFDLQPIGGSAVATTGGGGMLIKAGLTMLFTVRDRFGIDRQVRCSLPVAVKPNNHGSEILGMDQLAQVNAKVRWDPAAQEGDVYE